MSTVWQSSAGPSKSRGYLPWLVGLCAGLLYLLTLAPGVLWQDGGMFQVRVWQGDLEGKLGLALAHPLYIALCKSFTWCLPGDFAWRVNLFSAVTSAAALGLIFAGLRRLTRSWGAALVAVVLLAVSHTYWTYAVIAEVYGLYALALAGEMYLLIRYHQQRLGSAWWLVGLFFINGLNVSNHLLALLHLPAYAAYVLLQVRTKRISARYLLVMALAWIIGAGLYQAMIILQIVRGAGCLQTINSALFGVRWQDQVIGRMPGLSGLGKCLGYFLLNFPTPLILLGPVGAYLAWRDRRTRAVVGLWLGLFALAFVFAVRYYVPDQYVFFFPCYILLACFVGLGISRIPKVQGLRWAGRIAVMLLALLPAGVYEFAPGAVRKVALLRRIMDNALPSQRAVPGRDTYVHFLRPRRNGNHSPRDFALAALQLAQPDGLIASDNTTRNPIIYLQRVEARHPGVHLSKGSDLQAPNEVNADLATVEQWLSSGRQVFMVSPARQTGLAEKLKNRGGFKLVKAGVLHEIRYAKEPEN